MSDCIVGYNVYLDLLPDELKKKELISTPMKQEVRRCEIVYEEALKGKTVSIICSGDAGVYGMASLMYELKERYPDTTLEVIPGITAALSGAAVLGAPVNHDFCIISLSDLLTPWEKIEKRLRAASDGDFAIVLYNPSSHKRKDYLKRACEILLETIENDRPCGYVKNIGRDGQESGVMTLSELRDFEADMFTTVFIGNSESRIIDGALVTGRGYKIE
jgi:precorrin-3B C17-methyltransferase